MTPEAWTFLAAFALACAAWMAVTWNRDQLKAANDNLVRANAKLRERATKAEHAVDRLLSARPEFKTPGFVQPRARDVVWRDLREAADLTQAEHIADAIERVEYGPVEAARRGVSLPGAEVVQLRPKGDA